jgi:TIR domain
VEPIFINFRTGDQDMAAPFLRAHLLSRFGEGAVFYSSGSIRIGDDFSAELREHAEGCTVMLALIGPRWLTIAGADGRPLLVNPNDWVRREIATALAAGRRVVPVLLGDAPRLTGGDGLPADIAPLAGKEHCYLRRRSLAGDLATLEEELVKVAGVPRPAFPAPAPDGTATVGFSHGNVAAVRIGETTASSPALRDLVKDFSVNIGYQGPSGVASVLDIGKWAGNGDWDSPADGSGPTLPSA